MTRSPRHLWRGDWRADSESARDAAERERLVLGEAEAEYSIEAGDLEKSPRAPTRRLVWIRRLTASALAVGVIVGGAFAVSTLLDGGGRGADDRTGSLPAVSNEPVKPRSGQTQTGAIYTAASPAVVSIRAGNGSGTGFVIDRDGTIVTNSHVVRSSENVTVRFGPDSDAIRANVLGTDPSSDLAVVSVDPQRLPGGMSPLQLADSRTVQVGDRAIAIGNPFGLDRTATEGIVSGVGREIQAPNGFSIDSVIQTDAPINPGNSGGPLLNDAGHVIGVNSQIETAGSPGNVGIGFAVPSNIVRQVVPILGRGESIKRAYLGLQSSPASPSSSSGAEVQSVVSDGPAERAGIRPGDVVIGVDGLTMGDPSDIAAAIADKKPGEEVEVRVQRDGSNLTFRATLGTRPGATP